MDMNGVQQQEAGLGEAATSHNAAISFVELPSLSSSECKEEDQVPVVHNQQSNPVFAPPSLEHVVESALRRDMEKAQRAQGGVVHV